MLVCRCTSCAVHYDFPTNLGQQKEGPPLALPHEYLTSCLETHQLRLVAYWQAADTSLVPVVIVLA